MPPPFLDHNPRLGSTPEPSHRQTFVAKFAVKTLVQTVLPGLARLNQRQIQRVPSRPFEQRLQHELLSDDHLTVHGDSHCRATKKWLLRAGSEAHIQAGLKTIIEAGSELTIKAGNGFIKLDPSGVTVGGSKVRINSGDRPGSGTGANPLLPRLSRGVDKGVDVQSSVFRGPSMAVSLREASGKAAGVCELCTRTPKKEENGHAG